MNFVVFELPFQVGVYFEVGSGKASELRLSLRPSIEKEAITCSL